VEAVLFFGGSASANPVGHRLHRVTVDLQRRTLEKEVGVVLASQPAIFRSQVVFGN
jgi:hypothetical protein